MTQNYIRQVLGHFSEVLAKTETQTMTLSLRAQLLHEAKSVQETLRALVVQSELGHSEVFFIGTLEHFIACARLERADQLKLSCGMLYGELERIVGCLDAAPALSYVADPAARYAVNPIG